MKKQYYYQKDGEKVGPFNEAQFKDLQLPPDTLVWCYGMEDWMTYKDYAFQEMMETQKKSSKKRRIHGIKIGKISPKRIMIVCGGVAGIALLLAAVLFLVDVWLFSYPDYVHGYFQKFAYHYELPNNSLVEELLNKAKQASDNKMGDLATYYIDQAVYQKCTKEDLTVEVMANVQEYGSPSAYKYYCANCNFQDNPDILSYKAWNHYLSGNDDLAVRFAQQALLENCSLYLGATAALIYISYNRADWENVERWLEYRLSKNSEMSPIWKFIRAKALVELGRREEAVPIYNEAFKQSKDGKDLEAWAIKYRNDAYLALTNHQ